MGAFSWQNVTYTIQFILTIYINSEKLMLPEDVLLLNFSVESAENWEKQQKVATPSYLTIQKKLVWCFVLKQNITHETTKSKDV